MDHLGNEMHQEIVCECAFDVPSFAFFKPFPPAAGNMGP
jgi:hypothetical protein